MNDLIAVIDRISAELDAMRRIITSDGAEPCDMADLLRVRVRENGRSITPDGFVDEAAAAELVGRSPHTLRRWRAEHRPIAFRLVHGRVQYSLEEIAAYLRAGREMPDE